jgi:protein tyrosine phosphatase (PTP) superfamily phosphohydrolase (DUF442 family)
MMNLRARMFRPRNTYIGPAVPVESGPPLEYGQPAPGVIAPGPALAPGSTLTPPVESTVPQQLEPIPSAKPGSPADSSSGARNSTGKANYEARLPRYRSARPRNEAVARALNSTPEPTPRSAPGTVSPSATVGALNPLDNLPPLDLPRDDDVNREGPAPAAPEARPAATPDQAESQPGSNQGPAEVSVAPGIRRFVSLEPKLDGGSLPSMAGLDWLAEKGYRTILDLRETGDGRPEFISEVAKRGMRYVALPVGVKSVDRDLVSRFNFELSLSNARPLYFCDTDGTRAGMMWYIRRLTVDKVDPQVANREAEELGLADKSFWLAASTYLESVNPPPRPAPEPPKPAPAVPPKPEDVAPPAPQPQAVVPAPGPIAQTVPDVPGSPALPDPTAWRSVAAMMVTGLGIPLAYWSRSTFPTFRTLRRASLPAPARQPRSLPPASGA